MLLVINYLDAFFLVYGQIVNAKNHLNFNKWKKFNFVLKLQRYTNADLKISSIFLSSYENSMLKISHENTFYFLRHVHVRYVKYK